MLEGAGRLLRSRSSGASTSSSRPDRYPVARTTASTSHVPPFVSLTPDAVNASMPGTTSISPALMRATVPMSRTGVPVLQHLRSRRIRPDLVGKGESRQRRMRLGCVETQAVVMPAPACADLLLRLYQDERNPSLRETCRRRQTGRSGADDQHVTRVHER
jgi:hypothetical protein